MRLFRWIIVGALGLLAVGVALTWFFRVSLVEDLARLSLIRAGYPDATLTFTRVGLTGAEVENLDLGADGPRIDRLTLRYTIAGLIGGRLEAAELDSPRYAIDLAGTGEPPVPAAENPRSVPLLDRFMEPLVNLGADIRIRNGELDLLSVPALGDLRFGVEAHGDFSVADAPLEMTLTGLSTDDRDLSWRMRGGLQQGRLRLSGPAAMSLAGLEIGGAEILSARYAGPLSLDLGSDDLRIEGADGVDFELRQRAANGTGTRLRGQLGGPTVAAGWNGDAVTELAVTGGTIDLADQGYRLALGAVSVPLGNGGLAGEARARVRISPVGPDPIIAPQTVEIVARPGPDGAIEVAGGIDLPRRGGRLPLAGTVAASGDRGALRLGPATVTFAPDGLRPSDLSPLLAGLTEARGPVGVEASVTLASDGDPDTRVELDFTGVDMDVAGSGLRGLRGTVAVGGQGARFATTAPQTLTADRLTGPFPLDAPRLRFGLDPAPDGLRLVLEEAVGQFSEGTVRIEPVTLDFAQPENDLTVRLEMVSLTRLLDDFAAQRVSGTGVLSGSIPVKITPTGVIIPDGLLKADDAGTVKVNWGEARRAMLAQGEEVGLLVRALEDFRYERLEVGIGRPAEGELSFAITLEGQNPEVLDGQPFVFNITLSGNLEELLSALSAGNGITTDLLRGQLGAGR